MLKVYYQTYFGKQYYLYRLNLVYEKLFPVLCKYNTLLPKLLRAASPEETLATWSTPILSASSAANV